MGVDVEGVRGMGRGTGDVAVKTATGSAKEKARVQERTHGVRLSAVVSWGRFRLRSLCSKDRYYHPVPITPPSPSSPSAPAVPSPSLAAAATEQASFGDIVYIRM
ncbi:hypothetical protein BDQ17DRAFT_1427770 [Cyathus striatus]|nr:hypothetical protein BDQ17DRAFT_1427770 [Cyathus striatus]